jgi:hypothetical protein
MRTEVSNPDEIYGRLNESIDDLLTSVDAMRWTPTPSGTAVADGPKDGMSTTSTEPDDLKARFDALYETIDAFAGAVDDRLRTFASKVEGDFAESVANVSALADNDTRLRSRSGSRTSPSNRAR